MSVPGYIAGNRGGGLKMPRVAEKGKDNVGIRFSGSVLTGEKSVEQRFRESDMRARMEVDKREREKEEPERDWNLRDENGRQLYPFRWGKVASATDSGSRGRVPRDRFAAGCLWG